MRGIRTFTLMLFALGLQACTNAQPAYYGTYPSDYESGTNHSYEPYASGPHDPNGAYYQNYGPAVPYFYEPPESHRNCDERPCVAYSRPQVEALAPKMIAVPSKNEPLNPPSTISRYPQPPKSTSNN